MTEVERFRRIFRHVHASHRSCRDDEWLSEPCRDADGSLAERPIVWSRRNGPWRRVPVLWVGAAPGNAGGLGSGDLGAHGTRIPFGGDIAGANLDVLLSSIGITRNETFIVAAYNQLPARGGGEPSAAELAAPVGAYPDSGALLRDTVIAAGPALIIALGNVALRTLAAALTRAYTAPAGRPTAAPRLRLPAQKRLHDAGLARGFVHDWPDTLPLATGFRAAWRAAWGDEPAIRVLPVLHPSAQNMSPFAGTATLFHTRMLDTRQALVAAARTVLGWAPPAQRPHLPDDGIYALPEWRGRIAQRQARYDELWRERGV
ncbi:MAG TPA: uracil-DNA glycosylase family protein [Longimicrobiales bacterium]|nr:uracil-DNA glycosylase family protein [Longimicrobiales bacterium]